jgi:hypothetical protein
MFAINFCRDACSLFPLLDFYFFFKVVAFFILIGFWNVVFFLFCFLLRNII